MTGEILIAGASFAGLAAAHWLQRLGYRVTVVEIAPALRRGGTPVNLRGQTLGVIERMGLLDLIRERQLRMQVTQVEGEQDAFAWAEREGEDIEIERDVLLQLLFETVRGKVEVRFADHIVSLQDRADGVDVTLASGTRGRFHLVLGCDGLRSPLRAMVFGPHEEFWHFLGAYGSVTILPRALVPDGASLMHREPGKAVVINGYNGKTDIILMFWADRKLEFNRRDSAAKRAVLSQAFASVTWREQDWLREVERDAELYFDELAQIRMPSWWRGRVALVGDAAYCASPAAGRGGSLALDGAAALGDALQACGDQHEEAFREYERSFRLYIEQVQKEAEAFCADFLRPAARS